VIDQALKSEVRELVRREMDARTRSPIFNSTVSPRGVAQGRVAKRLVTSLPRVAQEFDEVHLEHEGVYSSWVYINGSWHQVGIPPLVTSMPANPYEGMEVRYVADDTNGVVWTFRYRSDGDATYPWEYAGGAPMWAEVATSQSTTTTSYTNLATTGPAITVPLAGMFYVSHGASMQAATAAVTEATMSYQIGGTAASDDDWIYFVGRDQFDSAHLARTRRKTLAAAGTTLTAKYRAQSGTQANFDDRWIAVEPIRVAA
jgi:hypothetical protein